MKLKDFLEGKLVGCYVNRIKKRRNIDDHCALSLLMDEVLFEQQAKLPPSTDNAFWVVFAPVLIQSFETRKNWDDVLTVCF